MSLTETKLESTPNLGAGTSRGPLDRYSESFYRPDIQGLRAISAVLIMVFHIWATRVSGGVDTFIVLSGFLITSVLLRDVARNGRVRPIAFWARILRRVFPSAYVVLVASALLSVVFIAPPLWKYGVTDFVASSVHLENFELIRMGANYLDREAPQSQFQQFWALSIQLQFYALLPLLVFALTWVSGKTRTVAPLFLGCGVMVFASFAHALHAVDLNPDAAYFSPLTRAWEFGTGALVAVAYPHIRGWAARATSLRPLALLGLLGLALFFLCGPLVGDRSFPGMVALVPVMAAVALLVAGANPAANGAVVRVLSLPGLVTVGSFSFTLYLWHWPILVFMQHHLGSTELGILPGLAVIATAGVLAYLTHRWVEEPGRRAPSQSATRDLIVYTAVLAVVAGSGVGLRQVIAASGSDASATSGRATPYQAMSQVDAVSFPLSAYVGVDYDRPTGIRDCLQMRRCELGEAQADRVIAMVGSSHTAHWVDVFDHVGKELGFRVVTYLDAPDLSKVIREIKPDVVVTNSTQTRMGDDKAKERIPASYSKGWKQLTAAGIQVVGIRDNPRFDFFQNACVWENRDEVSKCSLQRDGVFAAQDPAAAWESKLPGFNAVDLTDLLCTDESCPAATEKTFTYYDKHHFTKTFLDMIAPAAIEELQTQVPDVFAK